MEVKILDYNEINDNFKISWDSMISEYELNCFYSSSIWLDTISKSSAISPKLLTVFKDEKLLGGMIIDILGTNQVSKDYNPNYLLSDYNPSIELPTNFDVLRKKINKMILCTNRSSTSFDFRFIEDINNDEKKIIFEESIIFLERLRLPIIFMYVPDSDSIVNQVLKKKHYIRYFINNNYYLPQVSYEDYLNLFKSRKKKNIKREIKKFVDSEYQISQVELSYKNIELFSRFFEKNFVKYNNYEFNCQYFVNRLWSLINNLKEENIFLYFLYKDYNCAVGASLDIKYKNIIYGYQIGIDYEKVNKVIAPYFYLSFYNSLFNSSNQKNILNLSIGLDKEKINRAFKAEKNLLYIHSDLVYSSNFDTLNKYIEDYYNDLYNKYSKNIVR